jgi:hypothetical protein
METTLPLISAEEARSVGQPNPNLNEKDLVLWNEIKAGIHSALLRGEKHSATVYLHLEPNEYINPHIFAMLKHKGYLAELYMSNPEGHGFNRFIDKEKKLCIVLPKQDGIQVLHKGVIGKIILSWYP